MRGQGDEVLGLVAASVFLHERKDLNLRQIVSLDVAGAVIEEGRQLVEERRRRDLFDVGLDGDQIQIHQGAARVAADCHSRKAFHQLLHDELDRQLKQVFGDVRRNEPAVDGIVQLRRKQCELMCHQPHIVSFRRRVVRVPLVVRNQVRHIVDDNDGTLEDLVQVAPQVRDHTHKVAVKGRQARQHCLGNIVGQMLLDFRQTLGDENEGLDTSRSLGDAKHRLFALQFDGRVHPRCSNARQATGQCFGVAGTL